MHACTTCCPRSLTWNCDRATQAQAPGRPRAERRRGGDCARALLSKGKTNHSPAHACTRAGAGSGAGVAPVGHTPDDAAVGFQPGSVNPNSSKTRPHVAGLFVPERQNLVLTLCFQHESNRFAPAKPSVRGQSGGKKHEENQRAPVAPLAPARKTLLRTFFVKTGAPMLVGSSWAVSFEGNSRPACALVGRFFHLVKSRPEGTARMKLERGAFGAGSRPPTAA